MYFEFTPDPDFNFLEQFGKQFGIPFSDNILHIPSALGEGYIRIVDLYPDFKLLIHRYKLKEHLLLRRLAAPVKTDMVSVILNSNEEPARMSARDQDIQFSKNSDYAIQISGTDLDSEVRFTANRDIYFTVIGMPAFRLRQMLQLSKSHPVADTILNGDGGYLFYESMTPDVQKVLKQLILSDPAHELASFYYKIKVQELFYLLFERFLSREATNHTPINKNDVAALFLLRSLVLEDLSNPPVLGALARKIGMSETKMKHLFRQVFGDSIYNLFQRARMEEAALLLRQNGRSVADVGYELGFSNMSHFGRLFEKHHGIKPKRYASGG